MQQLRRFLCRAIALFRFGTAESDLAREIEAHLQLLEDKFVAQGMTREDARYAATRAFGGVEQAKERQRDERSFRWLAGWAMDLKLGVRMLVKSPGLTIVAVIALAVAIGGGAAYLEFVNDFFRPRLAFPGSDRLVGLLITTLPRRTSSSGRCTSSPPGKISSRPRRAWGRPTDRTELDYRRRPHRARPGRRDQRVRVPRRSQGGAARPPAPG